MYKKRFLTLTLVTLLTAAASLQAGDNTSDMVEDALSKITFSLDRIPERINKVAVYAITPDKAGRVNIANLQDQIMTILVETGRFAVIDRSSLKALMEE